MECVIKSTAWAIGWLMFGIVLVALGTTIVHGQLLVPPPPVNSSDGFNQRDREKLEQIYWHCKAVRQKMFPVLQDGNNCPHE